MSIQLLTGKIGAGKTLHGMEFIYDALCQGRTVATNIEVNFKPLQLLALKDRGVLIQEEQLIFLDLNNNLDWHEVVPWGVAGYPVLVVLDEIHLFFNSRDYAQTDKNHRGMLSFLSQSRKACVDVLFIAQVATQVEKQFRAQAQYEIEIKDFGNFYLPLVGRVPLRQNILVTRDLDSGSVMRKQKRDYPKRMFGTYNTYAFLDDSMREASEDRIRLEPLQLRKPKGDERKDLLIKLDNKNEVLDNINSYSSFSSFRRLVRFFRGSTIHQSGSVQGRENKTRGKTDNTGEADNRATA